MLESADPVSGPVELLAVLAAGLWALYLYRSTRKAQAKVGIEASARLHRDAYPGESVLLVRVRIVNTSNVLWRYDDVTATLLDASGRGDDGGVTFEAFAHGDPFVPAYGELVADGADPEAVGAFELGWGEWIGLEPGEYVESELAFPLVTDELDLMAMSVLVTGKAGRWRRRAWTWGSFFFIDPAFVPSAASPDVLEMPDAGG